MSFRSGKAAEEPAVRRQRQEIILIALALRAGLIGERMFVALAAMALFASPTTEHQDQNRAMSSRTRQ